MKKVCLFLAVLSLFGGRVVSGADLIISEFMAANENTLTDTDGEATDWIEIFNGGLAAVDVEGWYLTDETDLLDQWEFPAVVIDAGTYLLVFASGKNRRDPAAELHTNFRLSASGEYLALVEPDGVTIAHEYAPSFPEQLPDYSYGIGQDVRVTHLVPPKAPLRYHVPDDNTLGTAWTAFAFDDSGWAIGTSGIGYVTTVPGFAVLNFKATIAVGGLDTAEDVISTPGLQAGVDGDNPGVIDYLGTGGGRSLHGGHAVSRHGGGRR